MKSIQWILPLCAFMALSCGKKTDENDDGLTFTTSSKIILIDGNNYSCTDLLDPAPTPSLKSVSGKTAVLKLQWAGENDLEIQKITLKIRNSAIEGGEVTLNFAAENMVYSGNDPDTVHSTSCGLRFGGFPLKDKTRSAFMTGIITMSGITTDGDDNTTAVKATYDVDLEYTP